MLLVGFECVLNILTELNSLEEKINVYLWQVPQFHFLVVNLPSSISSKCIPIEINFILMS